MKTNPYRELWLTVLLQALIDAQRRGGRDLEWVGGKDFRMVCNLAGVDPEVAMEAFHHAPELTRLAA
jgi:hypothetical protein